MTRLNNEPAWWDWAHPGIGGAGRLIVNAIMWVVMTKGALVFGAWLYGFATGHA